MFYGLGLASFKVWYGFLGHEMCLVCIGVVQCFNGDIGSIKFGNFKWVVESATEGVNVGGRREKICFKYLRLMLLSFLVEMGF